MRDRDDKTRSGLGLASELRERILERLGFGAPPAADAQGLQAVYAAWCAHVPFDNVRKMIALRTSAQRPLPGGRVDDFFESWLAHGTGGTCWPTSNALFELLRSLGFDARRVAGCMRDLGFVNHASVVVDVDGTLQLVDSSLLTNVPLPLDDRVHVGDDPVFAVEIEPAGTTYLVWADTPPNPAHLPCRVDPSPVEAQFYSTAYEASRERSPFNQRLYARRNRPSKLLVLLGHTRYSKTRGGVGARDLSAEELCASLRDEIGLSGEIVDRWVAAGGLQASFEPPSGPKPPAVTGRPPSQRGAR